MESPAPALPQHPGGRLTGLDGLRGLAACLVAFGYHAQFLFAPGAFSPGWGGAIGLWLHHFGWTAVDLFFLLSGYVFAHVYLRGAAFRQGSFWAARIARLYPLHLALLAATAWVFRADPTNGPLAFAAHLAMAQAWIAPVGHTFDGPTWSLSVEMLCYLLFALGAARGARVLRGLTLAALLAGLAGLLWFGASAQLTTGSVIARGLLGFFTGQALWRCRVLLHRVPPAVLVTALACGLWLGTVGWLGPVLPLSLLAWPALLALGLRLPAFGSRPLVWLGDRSYAIYLLHMPLIDFVAFRWGGLPGDPLAVVAGHLGLIAVVLALADLVYRRLELPVRSGLRRWLQHPDKPRIATA